jgi:V/A-type H+-transporting ATPase subunit I
LVRWRDAVTPQPMTRVALVAPADRLRDSLVRVAAAGVVEIEHAPLPDAPPTDPARRLQRLAHAGTARPLLHPDTPDLDAWERDGRADLLAGEAELAGYAGEAVRRGRVAALVGWVPDADLPPLRQRLAPVGGALAPIPVPRGVQPPSLARPGRAGTAFGPLVRTYATVPYRDLDPTVLAGVAYVVMFGAMFGDVGDGALLLAGALLLRTGRPRRLSALRPHWLFVAAAGLASMLFGLAYGEFFGPTGLAPPPLLSPMEQPLPLLVAGIGLGALLLAGSYLVGTVNRVREGGWAVALYAPSGLAGGLLFGAAGLVAWAWYAGLSWLGVVAALLALGALGLAFVGLLAAAGGGATGLLQAAVQLFDMAVRLVANVMSFARLAAFGLTHAVLAWIVWRATLALWHAGPAGAVAAVVVFLVGGAATFALEALVAAVQALRLEYYELFSRVFELEGRPFRPWQVPVATDPRAEEAS